MNAIARRHSSHAAERRDDLVSIIVRFHDPDALEDLSLCLATIALQSHEPIEVLICCQHLATAALEAVRAVAASTAWGSPARNCRVLDFDAATPYADCRADLLNLGLAEARGRYVAFLDYDDFLFADFLRASIAALRSGDCAVSAAGVIQADLEGRGLSQHVRALREPFDATDHYRFFERNHHVIQGYVIDRDRIDGTLSFTPGMCRHEDYWFFLQVLARHRLDRRNVARPLCQYNLRLDGSDTVRDHAALDHEKQRAWRRADAVIEALKSELLIHVPYYDLLDLLNRAPADTRPDDDLFAQMLRAAAPLVGRAVADGTADGVGGTGAIDALTRTGRGLAIDGWIADANRAATLAAWTLVGFDHAGRAVPLAPGHRHVHGRADVARFLGRHEARAEYGFAGVFDLAEGAEPVTLVVVGCLRDGSIVGLRARHGAWVASLATTASPSVPPSPAA